MLSFYTADVPIVKEKSRRKELQERLLNREKLGTVMKMFLFYSSLNKRSSLA